MLVIRFRNRVVHFSEHALARIVCIAIGFVAAFRLPLVALRLPLAGYGGRSAVAPRAVCRIDHGSFTNGARVVDAWTSASFSPPGVDPYSPTPSHPSLNLLTHASRGTPSIPELALGLTGDPRALWFFDGVRGTLGFVLPEPVVVDTVRINGHLSHGPARRCLPRDLVIWGAILPSQSDNLTWSMFDWPNTPLPQELAGPAHPGLARAGTFAVPPEVVWIPLTQLHDVSRSSDRDFAITGASVGIGIPVYAVTVQFLRNYGEE
ncbi:hypothetical protein AURDEDRAFT_172126 [Auricularia subglabra TFB-10046 SS5]|nr:hypothetical protein AURDEDRAFT_172126 [Auricularia subglabra TFB-10046 SS5]